MSKKKDKSKSQNHKFDFFKSFFVALISGLSVVFFQQLFLKNNVNYELGKESIKDYYQYNGAIQNFVDLNNITEIRFETTLGITSFAPLVNDSIRSDTTFKTIQHAPSFMIPTIAVNDKMQVEWEKERSVIESNKNKIDYEIYVLFEEITRIVDESPWPSEGSKENLMKSYWSDEDFMDKWFEKNMILHCKVSEYVKME